ncbi:MAG: AbrB/MazE/SpoVT family DNA-binding domain-containing protein [Candidatus Neomarinimicrobiota bacterium]|nr:MAG: AbrB/MazE/SpoVT family DNA-binding domain-containing protein [Candidatus Neomarinimicrobiota bacterium]
MAQIVSAKGSIVIPAKIRNKFCIKPGKRVEVIEDDNKIYVVPLPDDTIEAGYGMFKSKQSVMEILKEGREEDKKREEELLSLGTDEDERKRKNCAG